MLLSVEEKSRFFVHIFEKKQLFATPKFGTKFDSESFFMKMAKYQGKK